MAARKQPYGIQAHPQFKAITEALVRGESARSVAQWANPKVAPNTVARYCRMIVAPTLKNAEALKSVLPDNIRQSQGIAATCAAAGSVVRAGGSVAQQANSVTKTEEVATSAITSAPIIAIREKRIAELEDLRARLRQVVDARAVDEDMLKAPGGASGLLTIDYKGKDADRAVYRVDTGLIGEIRELLKQAAVELGEWQENNAVNVAVQIVYPVTSGAAVRHEDPGQMDGVEIIGR